MTPPLAIPAGNASVWTGPTGNNTWLLTGPASALVDAGIGAAAHVDAVAAALEGNALASILITHGHRDHASGIPALLSRWPSATVFAAGPVHPAVHAVTDGNTIAAGDTRVRVIGTPGHAPDHLCFFDEQSRDLFCGDLVRLGGTIVIPASQGGSVRLYLESLRRVRALGPQRLLPGHGPVVEDPAALIDAYLAHRAEREAQILAAIRSGAKTPDEIVESVYGALEPELRGAAVDGVIAHVRKLREDGTLPPDE
jgi:glyoxylase-like metal-dependent hydrolase (beta-lactamase superfamily II)